MADVLNDNKKVISKKDSGFPAYLDFDKLRSEGIEYLGKLAGKIWTDHNVHDPGITILEALCYALLDLGYRINLPTEDIFARDPLDTSIDDNFLAPSKILTCNPLTITDLRKLLVDIEGVRNAWLEVATDFDPEKFCNPDQTPPSNPTGEQTPSRQFPARQPNGTSDGPANPSPSPLPKECCIEYLNGLYHVYLELEKSKEEEIGDLENKKTFLKKIQQALLSHRNLCEDFIDIKFLCKWEIGVCAEIELQPDADPEEVYLTMMEKLRDFFSPSPQFYTLSQLLEKKKTIDEIFAGRPYNIGESHGFVDTEEFEKLELRKSIHVSDVYCVLFSILGIRKVQRLRLRNCGGGKSLQPDQWVMHIKEDHVSEFSSSCSEFRFLRQGMPVSFDFKKYEAILAIEFDHNGKVIVPPGPDKLDPKFPGGYYRKEIGNWLSIQNDFPRVYGISEGGLPADVTRKRKSQALQLKGYLLFFDQLLANYVSQLKNIRNLFSLSLPDTTEKKHTYFINNINTVPGLQELLRFPVDVNSVAPTGIETGVLAFPAGRKEIEDLIENGQIEKLDIEKFRHKVFTTEAERNIAVCQLQEDAYNDLLNFYYVTKDDGSIFYYAFSSSQDCALIGTRYYSDTQAAKNATTALLFAASVASNYKTYFAATQKKFSFNLEQKLSTYPEYLQLLVEDEATYLERRDSFLNHLLARFAERFTDYALISYENLTAEDTRKNDIRTKEFFLSNYAILSSNRGLALNYLDAGWNSENISGFEKKCKTLMGASNLGRESLCNFFVYEYDDARYIFSMTLAGKQFFKSDEKFESKEEAWHALQKLIDSL